MSSISGSNFISLVLVALLTAAPSLAFSARAADGSKSEYAVGVAAVDVTPDYPIRLNGFGNRREESDGITQRIWAKALAIGTDAQKPLILITLDNLGIRLPMAEDVARQLKEKAGIERARLAITFTHSHTTPKVAGSCDTIFSSPMPPEHQAHIDRYTKELTDALVKVSLQALADRKLSRLEWATGQVKFAMNRRTPGGPVDHSLPTLLVRSAEDNAIRAIYVTYACHCVTLSNNKISGDWAGFAQEAIERKNPGAVAMVSIGCGSDANPNSGVTGDNVAAAAEQGAEIADQVQRLLKGTFTPITGKVRTTYATIDLPLNDLPSKADLEVAAANADAAGYNAQYQLAKLGRGEPLQSKIDYPIQAWSFGNSLCMVFLGGEICVDYTVRLRKELDASRVWLHGYSNDFCCYIPSERLLKEGGYGGGGEIVYFGLPTTLRPGLEAQIISEVHNQVPPMFAAYRQAAQPGSAVTEIAKLTERLAVGTPAEYERIPEIWRVAIDAGKRNDAAELRKILEIAVPQLEKPAAHWQVVVIGGGILNGLSQQGVWPRERMRELIQLDPAMIRRCHRLLEQAATMADDESVPSGTRYDALRILGADDYANSGEHLTRYLSSKDAELQMGAISGLSDMQNDAVGNDLISAYSHYTPDNRKLAIAALLRTNERKALLKKALAEGQVDKNELTPEQSAQLNAK
jgi:hypothetical protein